MEPIDNVTYLRIESSLLMFTCSTFPLFAQVYDLELALYLSEQKILRTPECHYAPF